MINKKYLVNRITSKKVLICCVIGLILLFMLLALSKGYFNLKWPNWPNFRALANNLASVLDGSGSLNDWLWEGKDKLVEFLKEKVPWVKTLTVVAAFIGFCYGIFQHLRSAIERLTGRELAPFNWDIKTAILSKIDLDRYIGSLVGGLKSKIKEKEEEIESLDDVGKLIADTEGIRGNEYLFLIDQFAPGDHFSLLWNSVVGQFEKHGIRTDSYFFNGDLRLCFNEDHKSGIGLQGLLDLHNKSILVVISDGYRLFDLQKTCLYDWIPQLEPWPVRFLLTPKNANEWDAREDQLRDWFHVLPAKLSSITHLIHQPNKDGKSEFNIEWVEKESLLDYQEINFTPENLPKYFDQPALDWIKACASQPDLHYHMSLEIGKEIYEAAGVDFSLSQILAVFELPWFRLAGMPSEERAKLTKNLIEESPGNDSLLRKFLLIRLPGLRPPEGSISYFIHRQWELVNKWFIKNPKPDRKTRKEIKNDLNAIYHIGIEPNRFLFITDGIHNRFSRHFGSWAKYIFNYGLSGLGLRQVIKNILYAILAGLILLVTYLIVLWLSRPNPSPPKLGLIIEKTIEVPRRDTIEVPRRDTIEITIPGDPGDTTVAWIHTHSHSHTHTQDTIPIFIDGHSTSVVHNHSRDTIWMPNGDTAIYPINIYPGDSIKVFVGGEINIYTWTDIDISIFVPVGDTTEMRIVDSLACRLDTALTDDLVLRGIHALSPALLTSSLSSSLPFLDYLNRDFEYGGRRYLFSPPERIDQNLGRNACTTVLKYFVNDPDPNSVRVDTVEGEDSLIIIFWYEPRPPGPGGPDTGKVTVAVYDTIPVPIDSLVPRDTLIIRDSLRIRDTLIKIELPVVPRIDISGRITECGTEHMVRIDKMEYFDIGSSRIELAEFNDSTNYKFGYIANTWHPVELDYILRSPYELVSNQRFPHFEAAMIDQKQYRLNFEVEDKSFDINSEAQITGNIIIDGLRYDTSRCPTITPSNLENDNCYVAHNWMDDDSIRNRISLQYKIGDRIEKDSITIEVDGSFCFDTDELEYCGSTLLVEAKIDEVNDQVVELRNFWVNSSNPKLAKVRIGTVFLEPKDKKLRI